MLQRRRTALSSILVLASTAAIAACSASGHSTAPISTTTSTTNGMVDTSGFAVPSWATSAAYAGRLDEGTPIKVQVHLRMRNESAALAQFRDINDPDSPNYGNFLTDDQFDAAYGPLASDFAALQAHLTSFGLKVTEAPSNRAYVSVEGTAAQVNAAFGTTLGQYRVKGALKRAPMTLAKLPASLAPVVKGVLGLHEPMVMKPMYKRAPQHAPVGSGPITAETCTTYYGEIVDTIDPAYPGGPKALSYIGCPYVPPQIRAGYGLTAPVADGNDGTGQTIAILDAFTSPTLLADAQTYAKNHDPTHPLKSSQFKAYVGPGTPPTPSCSVTQDAYGWYGEQGLDVEAVHAVAPGADIAFVGAVDDSDQAFVAAINYIVTNHLASVVSNSWAGPEEGDAGGYTVYENAAIQAGLKGIGLYFASGDDGDYTQEIAQYGVTGFYPTPSFPTSLPEVTGVGGTSLEFNASGNREFETGWENGFSQLIPEGIDAGAWPPSGGGGGGGGGACSDDAGTGSDDAGAIVRPLGSPALPPPADAGTSDDAGSPAPGAGSTSGGAQIWWPAAPGGFGDGAGGGTSSVYVQPTWQEGVVPTSLSLFDPYPGTTAGPSRVVPDVGMLADPYTGFLVGETDPVAHTYSESGIGGTSLATPLFTASIALAQQHAGRHFGAANALLYKAAKYGALRDITPTATLQAVALPTYGFLATFGYTGPENTNTCTKGFDNETGLGTVNGTTFLDALKQH